jgi:preprotein translocase subunit SecB
MIAKLELSACTVILFFYLRNCSYKLTNIYQLYTLFLDSIYFIFDLFQEKVKAPAAPKAKATKTVKTAAPRVGGKR